MVESLFVFCAGPSPGRLPTPARRGELVQVASSQALAGVLQRPMGTVGALTALAFVALGLFLPMIAL